MNDKVFLRQIEIPAGLHRDTADLLRLFAEELGRKLEKAQLKHGYSTEWKTAPAEDLQAGMLAHIVKGDPRDVAAYCMFLWGRKADTVDPAFREGLLRGAELRALLATSPRP